MTISRKFAQKINTGQWFSHIQNAKSIEFCTGKRQQAKLNTKVIRFGIWFVEKLSIT